MGNLETLLAPGWPYMLDEAYIDNKNNCNASSRYLDAVRYGGFDAVAMANNHNCDGGKTALLETIRQVRAIIEKYNPACELEVDGGIAPDTAPLVVNAGANVLVAGSAVYGAKDIPAAIQALRV